MRLLVGELGTPKLAQIFAYDKWLYPYRMLLHGASDLDQRCLKTRSSEADQNLRTKPRWVIYPLLAVVRGSDRVNSKG